MPQEPPFLLENIEYSAKLGLWLLVSAHDITTTNLPTAGTTTVTSLKLPTAGRPNSTYDAYIYTHLSPAATAGYFRLNFVDVLPTTPLVTQRIDPIWGLVQTHTYLALTASELPLRATEYPASSGRYVLDSTETQLSGDVCIVRVETVASLTATQTDKLVDDETGALFTQTKTYTLATTNPTGAATGSNALFTEVTQQSFRLWLSTTRPSAFVPVLSGSAITSLTGAKQRMTTDSMFWPPVLESYRFDSVMNPIDPFSDSVRFQMLFTPKLRDGYSGPVKCLVKEWWQATEPNATERPELNNLSMVPVAIRFPGRLQQFSVEPCLHGVVTFGEPNLLGTITAVEGNVTVLSDVSFINREWSFAATTPTDWPETFVVFRSEPRNGGFYCEQRTFYRPTITGGSFTVTDEAFVLAEHGWRDPPIDGTFISIP